MGKLKMNEIASFQIDSDDLLAIYVCLHQYAYIVKEQNPEGAEKIFKTKDKIWNQLTKDLKAKIDPDRYDREKWNEATITLRHQDDH